MSLLLTIKKISLALLPPFLVSAFLKFRNQHNNNNEVWSGDYESWNEARLHSSGYGDSSILEKCKNALLKVKEGKAVYERDSILFDEIQYSWGLLAGLQRAAFDNHGNLCVLDFGGSLGSTYFQNKEFLSVINELRWSVVEQKHFVDCGKESFENPQLKFYYSIEECLSINKPDAIVLSSVLQYLESPYEWIQRFVTLNIPYIIIDRTAFTDGERDILTVQNVPEEIYKASYPAWFFSKNRFIDAFQKNYKLIAEFDNGFTSPDVINGATRVYWRGLIFRK